MTSALDRLSELAKGPEPVSTEVAVQDVYVAIDNVTRENLAFVVNSAWAEGSDTGTLPTAMDLYASNPFGFAFSGIDEAMLTKMYSDPGFQRAIYLRGLRSPDNGLDARMLLALSVLTEFSTKRTLNSKLKQVGIRPDEYAAWLQYKPFHDKLVKLSNAALKGSVSNSKVALASSAANGDLNSIKFLMEITGEHDPNKQSQYDAEKMVRGMAEIVSRHVTNPDTLRQIAAEVSMLMAANGMDVT